MRKIEIACFNIASAVIAQENGADRIELCAEMNLGGTTPTYEDVVKVRELATIDLNVMVRPRGGSFVYTDKEFQQMKEQVVELKGLGVDGLVFGILDEENEVCLMKNKELVDLAFPLPCTFHRAFDRTKDYKKSLEDIISCGFKTVLTSGCPTNVIEGLTNLRSLVELSDNRIVVMPGGGLRSSNILRVLRETQATYFHSSAITDGTETAVPAEVSALKSQLSF